MTGDAIPWMKHYQARAGGEICQRCDIYFNLTDILVEPTDLEMEIAMKAAKFARLLHAWWIKDEPLDLNSLDGDMRPYGGTYSIAQWARHYFMDDPFRKGVIELEMKSKERKLKDARDLGEQRVLLKIDKEIKALEKIIKNIYKPKSLKMIQEPQKYNNIPVCVALRRLRNVRDKFDKKKSGRSPRSTNRRKRI